MSLEIAYWRGERIDEMSREELLEVVRAMGRLVKHYFSPDEIKARALGHVEMIKRGEAAQ